MKGIIKITLALVTVFSTSFILNGIFGWLTVENVTAYLTALRASPEATLWIFLAVIALLAVDSLLAVPTITTILLSGWLLGPAWGGIASAAGVMIAGAICYTGGRYGGHAFFRRIASDGETQRTREWFEQAGGVTLILSRSLPMLPEVLSCLAGITKMNPLRYLGLFALGNIPFAFLAAWAGSVSTLEKPWPALVVGMGVPAIAWAIWYATGRRKKRAEAPVAVQGDATIQGGAVNGTSN